MGLNWLEDQAIGPRRFSEAVLHRWAASAAESPLHQRPEPTVSDLATSRFSSSSRPRVRGRNDAWETPLPPIETNFAWGNEVTPSSPDGPSLALAWATAPVNSHAVLAALPEHRSADPSTQEASAGASRCLCPVCSQLEVINPNVETLEAPGGEQAAPAAAASITLASSLDTSKTFFLHSNPSANHTIYLDFDGYYIASSQWENGGALQLKPFYTDFTSSTTLLEIQRIWQRMAEDFAPFQVNVTTQEPNTEDLRKSGTGDTRWGIRMAFTYNTNLLTGNPIINAGGGGTAYYNSFNWSTDDVALGFNRGEYAAAETGSHEVGHTLNLRHDGGSYGSNAEYYEGHGGTGATSWGPVMGAPFINSDENLTTWSRGEYIGANNTQDDLTTITNGNGFTYLGDDHGNSQASATLLQGVNFSQYGIIERTSDLDWFRFDTGTGNVNLSITNAARVFVADGLGGYTSEYLAARGPNLDISASLYRGDGTWIATSNPLDQITASFSNLYLQAGTYYLAIDGVSVGNPYSNPPSGYTDYGSLGQYMLSGTLIDPATSPGINVSPTTGLTTTEAAGPGRTATFSVSLTIAPTADVTIAVNSSDSSEGEVSTPLLTFTPSNWNVAQAVTITGIDDTESDGDVAYSIILEAAISGDPGYSGLDANDVSALNIDDDKPTITLSPNNQTLIEGASSPQSATYTVALSQASAVAVTVQYATSNGTATAGSDYTSTTGTLTFNPGQTSQTISISILNDNTNEANETFNLTLSNPTNGVLGNPISATTTISDTLVADATTILPANVENLTLLESSAAVDGTGNTGNNILIGNSQANVLTGANGFDTLTGNQGTDTFNLAGISAAINRDRITDFDVTLSTGDKIRLSHSLTSVIGSAPQPSWGLVNQASSVTLATATIDVFEFNFNNTKSGVNLENATDGSPLLAGLNTKGGSAKLSTNTPGGQGYIVAYDNSKAYLYYFNAGAGNTAVAANEIGLIGILEANPTTGIGVGSLAEAHFALV